MSLISPRNNCVSNLALVQHRSRHRVRRRSHCAVSPLAHEAGQGERHCNTAKYHIRSCIALFDLLLTKRDNLSRRRRFTGRTYMLVSLSLSPSLPSSRLDCLTFPRPFSLSMLIFTYLYVYAYRCVRCRRRFTARTSPTSPTCWPLSSSSSLLSTSRSFQQRPARSHADTHTHAHAHAHAHAHPNPKTLDSGPSTLTQPSNPDSRGRVFRASV